MSGRESLLKRIKALEENKPFVDVESDNSLFAGIDFHNLSMEELAPICEFFDIGNKYPRLANGTYTFSGISDDDRLRLTQLDELIEAWVSRKKEEAKIKKCLNLK